MGGAAEQRRARGGRRGGGGGGEQTCSMCAPRFPTNQAKSDSVAPSSSYTDRHTCKQPNARARTPTSRHVECRPSSFRSAQLSPHAQTSRLVERGRWSDLRCSMRQRRSGERVGERGRSPTAFTRRRASDSLPHRASRMRCNALTRPSHLAL